MKSKVLYGTIVHETEKAAKFRSKDGVWAWIPKSAISSVFRAGQHVTIYNWFKPKWLNGKFI